MPALEQLKNYAFGPNTAYDYLLALLIFVGLIIVLKAFQAIVLSRLKKLAQKTKTDLDNVLIDIFAKIRPPFYLLVSLYFGVKSLEMPEIAESVAKALFIITVVYEIIRALEKLINYAVERYLSRTKNGEAGPDYAKELLLQQESMAKTVKAISRILLWAVGIILVLSNLGINVTSIVASLGIGGVAVALALQSIFSDIFSSLSIYIDKPFQPGDFIVIGQDSGTVEKIGLKTTRVKTLQGEELVISNQELTAARVQNFKKMERRRVAFNLGITYGTSPEKLRKIPEIIGKIIGETDLVEFDRCHFSEYGDFSLNFEIVYYVNSAEYEQYMDARERINLEIYERFGKEGIEFAYPTQTVIVSKD